MTSNDDVVISSALLSDLCAIKNGGICFVLIVSILMMTKSDYNNGVGLPSCTKTKT